MKKPNVKSYHCLCGKWTIVSNWLFSRLDAYVELMHQNQNSDVLIKRCVNTILQILGSDIVLGLLSSHLLGYYLSLYMQFGLCCSLYYDNYYSDVNF